MRRQTTNSVAAVQNPCKLCTPLGAVLACKGIANCITLLHGSQGCATYIRRYLISHFREPVDIASSNFSEETAVFGGKQLFFKALDNIRQQYTPSVIAVATTCLSETIGDDVPAYIREYLAEQQGNTCPALIHISTPAYAGTHTDGFRESLRVIAGVFAARSRESRSINLFSWLISPADIRYLKELFNAFGLEYTLLPDYAETLDQGLWPDYQAIPGGGVTINELAVMGEAMVSLEFGAAFGDAESAGSLLQERFGIPYIRQPLPVGVKLTDSFMETLQHYSGTPIPACFKAERQRLIDAYVDAHKITAGQRAAVFGDEETVLAVSAFLSEIGVTPVICLSGSTRSALAANLPLYINNLAAESVVYDDADFITLKEALRGAGVDLMIGNSKGYSIAREYNIPLIRVGFPIHDRIGAARLSLLGYRGTQELFDRIANAILEYKQTQSPVGYTYW